MGAMQRNKGKGGELEFSKQLTWILDCDAERGRQYHGRQDAPDVHTDLDGIHFEVKRCESLSLYPAMEQAIGDAGTDVPVVAHRRNHRDWLLIIRMKDLPRFIRLTKDRLQGERDDRTPPDSGLPTA